MVYIGFDPTVRGDQLPLAWKTKSATFLRAALLTVIRKINVKKLLLACSQYTFGDLKVRVEEAVLI